MKLIVEVKAGDVTHEITLPVGPGTQTFKWLAVAAAYRVVHDEVHSSRRASHKINLRKQLLPKTVYTEDCPFLHPCDIIKDHLRDGSTVTVELYSSLELDSYGCPVLSPWAFIAFRHNERYEEERTRIMEEKKVEVDAFKEERDKQALIAKMNIERPKIRQMRQIMAPQLVADSAIAATLSKEWELIKDSGILDNIVPDKNQQEEILQFFTKYFVELNDLYKFYSAVNSGGGTHTLEYIELSKFLTETGILDESHSNAILRIFLDSHIKTKTASRRVKPSISSEIYRHEFFVALIKIAILKNITLPKRELSKLRKQGHQTSIAKSKLPAAPEALEKIYQDFLLPVLQNMPAGSSMREAIASDSVLILLYDNLQQLSQCFEKYAQSREDEVDEGQSSGSSIVPDGSMDLKNFDTFAGEAGFADTDIVTRKYSDHGRKHSIMGMRSSCSIGPKDVRQIFSASQHDSDVPAETERKMIIEDNGINSDQEVMVFSEFLEAIARLGVLKYHQTDSKLEDYECIKLAVERTCAVKTQ